MHNDEPGLHGDDDDQFVKVSERHSMALQRGRACGTWSEFELISPTLTSGEDEYSFKSFFDDSFYVLEAPGGGGDRRWDEERKDWVYVPGGGRQIVAFSETEAPAQPPAPAGPLLEPEPGADSPGFDD